MTTITIERELLEKIRRLTERGMSIGDRSALFNELTAILKTTQATAPAQPEIVDLLAEMYDLILANKVVLAEKSGGVWTWPDRAIEAVRKHRSGPAQPSWHDAPTVPGLWMNGINRHAQEVLQRHVDAGMLAEVNGQWFGPIPIPEDRQ